MTLTIRFYSVGPSVPGPTKKAELRDNEWPGLGEAAERDAPELRLRHRRHPHRPQDPHPTPEVPGGRKPGLLPPSPLRIPFGNGRQLVPRCQIPGTTFGSTSQLELVSFQSVAEVESLD